MIFINLNEDSFFLKDLTITAIRHSSIYTITSNISLLIYMTLPKNLMPRGFLKFYILKTLKNSPKHGYDLMKSIERSSGWRPSPGAIYPMLKRLKKLKYIEEQKQKNRIY